MATEQSVEKRTSGAGRVAVFYALYFMTIGISLPFLPGYFQTLGLSASDIGLLLAVSPTCALVAPPLWGTLADLTGRPGLVLAIVSTGATAGLALLAGAETFPQLLLALTAQAFFASSISTLCDSLALRQVPSGWSFARVRVFGSLGFVIASTGFGLAVSGYTRAIVLAPLVLMGAAAAWAATMLARAPRTWESGPRPTLLAALSLLQQKGVPVFLAITALHWVACAPYHATLAIYFRSLKLPPSAVGLSASVAVVSEIIVMVTWPRWASALPPRRLLALAFVGSGVRWAVMGLTSSPQVLVCIAALHGLTFGVFYLAAVQWMALRAPPSLRSTAQALFVAATFGIGGLIGYISTGRLYDVVGGASLFLIASVVEALPLAALALVGSAPAPASPAISE